MAKYKEEAVDYNPFEQTAPKYKEEAVDYDPFAAPKQQGPRVAGEGEGDFFRGLANVPGQVQNVYGASKVLAGLVANKAGADETGKSLIKSGMESMQAGEAKQVVKESDDFLKAWEKGIGTVVTDWLPYQIGAGAGNIAETLAFMGIGAATANAPGAIAGVLGKSMVKAGLKEAAEKIIKEEGKEAATKFISDQAKRTLMGVTAGKVAQAGMHGTGEVTGRAVEEAQGRGEKVEDVELSRVLPAAAAHAVADFFINKIGLDAMKIGEKAANSLIFEIGKRIAITGTKELPAEEIQTMAERYGAKLSLTDAEAMREYINTAAASYAMSVAPGTVGGARSHMTAQRNKAIEEATKTKENVDQKKSEIGSEKIAEDTTAVTDPDLEEKLKPAFGPNVQGVENVTGTKQQTIGTSTELAAKSGEGTAATGAGATVAEGVDATNATATQLTGRENEQSAPLAFDAKAGLEELNKLDAKLKRAEKRLSKDENLETGNPKIQASKDNLTKVKAQVEKRKAELYKQFDEWTASREQTKTEEPASIEGPYTPVTVTKDEVLAPYPTRVSNLPPAEKQEVIKGEFDPDKVLSEEEEKEQADKFYQESLGNGPQRHDKITKEQKEKYEETRAKLAEEGISIPEWGDEELNGAAKDVYFSHIIDDTTNENLEAGRRLAEYRKRMNELNIPKGEGRLVNSYENDREAQSKLFGIEFPEWTALPDNARAAYKQMMGKATSGIESQKGFQAIVDLAKRTQLKLKTAEEQKKEAEQTKAKTEQETKDTERQELNKEQPRGIGRGAFVPDKVVKMVKEGNLQGVLQFLRTGARNSIHKAIAQRIFEMKLNTKIQLVDKLPKKHLAIYDPQTDTIKVTAEGLTDTVLMHEVTHAATVKVLNHYLAGRYKQLTPEQLDAAEHLETLMEDTKPALGARYPEAYKDLYEFVGYAMTDGLFQEDLQGLRQNETHAITILPTEKSMWTEFKLGIAKLIGMGKKLFKGKNLNMDTPVNYFMEIASAFEDVLSVPEGKIDMAPLPTGQTLQAEALREVDLDTTNDGYGTKEKDKPKGISYFRRLFTTVPGWKLIATKFQNSRYPIKSWEDVHELAKKIYHEGKDKINNIYTQITFAAADAKNLYIQHVSEASERLDTYIGEFARASGKNTEDALIILHKIAEALHEPERRMVKYLLNVPLRVVAKTGERISPADRRAEIVKLLDTKTLTQAQAQQLRAELEYIVNDQTNLDAAGGSLDIDNPIYNVTGMTKASVDKITEQYKNHPQHDLIKQVLDSIQELHKATTALNRMANYWSQPVDNRVNFYGFKQYIPLKGTSANETDDMLAFDSMRGGKELQDIDHVFEGRVSVSDNPILQTMSDATRSALRAGRRNLTLSIKNAIDQRLLAGDTKTKISFEDRRNPEVIRKLPRENTVFHYEDDGSITVIKIFNENQREAIRRTYQQSKPIVDLANKVTSAIGTLHTRYNYAFAPMNFVRDALTNAFAIGADMGPMESVRFVKEITGQVLKGGMYKAMQVAVMYEKGDKKSQAALDQMAKNDPYIGDMVEFIKRGGMVSYLQGLALKSNFQALHREIGRSGIVKTKEQLDKFVDVWTDMFELASRAAAYGITKRNEISRGSSEETATVKAVAYAKNLANFEQVGDLGKTMGAFYMFFRPAATGAVRAIESVAPAFRSLESVVEGLPPSIKEDAAALEEFKKNYAEKQSHARIMTTALIGLGVMTYFMSMMMSDDDDLGRNAVATDNMQQWTRYARFHIPKDITKAMGINNPVVFQVPWGFGLGAFAAAGAQMAATIAGKSSVKDAMSNIFLQISLDSFVPIPVSKMPPTEMPLEFFLDSIAPSVARPILEFALNKNGLGQDIYNDQNRRFGDAYTGGDRVPEIYKDAARALANNTMGGIDISPNTMYFLSNSYLDGVGRVFEAGYGISDLAAGRKGFDPKTDLPLMGSFFGAKSNVDSREFSAVEKQIQEMERKVKMFETDPVQSARYTAAHPMDAMLVDTYNKEVNGQLKELRSLAKQYRQMQGLDPKTRDAMVKIVTLQQNLIKHNMVEQFKAYGIKP